MKKILSLVVLCFMVHTIFACTSAIISGSKTANGRPLLWKHRDTGEENNKVERITPKGGYEYVALFNASDLKCEEAWMGFNEKGFAIMNTASYNIKDDDIKDDDMDKEGLVMAEALKKCETVDDFEALLKSLPKPLCVEANFGVIDALGNGAYFETNNYDYKRFDLKDSKDGILTRTNYSYSGRDDEGYGYVREKNERTLLEKYVLEGKVTPMLFTETISRTYYHSLLNKDYTNDYSAVWLIDQDFIPRRTSTASCVIEGVLPGEDVSLTTMWIGLGFPPCSEVRAVWLGENGVPEELKGSLPNGHSSLCDQVVALKHKVFSRKSKSENMYFNKSLLYNEEGTGFAQLAKKKNEEYYRTVNLYLDKKRKEYKKNKVIKACGPQQL